MHWDQSDGGRKVSLDICCYLKVEEDLSGSIRSPRAKKLAWFGLKERAERGLKPAGRMSQTCTG